MKCYVQKKQNHFKRSCLFDSAKGIGLHGGDPIGAEVDTSGCDASEGVRLQSFNVVVIEVEVVDDQGAVEHVWRETSNEVLAQVQFVQAFGVTARQWILMLTISRASYINVQGDTSGCAKPPVDFKTKVPLWPGQASPCQAKMELLF